MIDDGNYKVAYDMLMHRHHLLRERYRKVCADRLAIPYVRELQDTVSRQDARIRELEGLSSTTQ